MKNQLLYFVIFIPLIISGCGQCGKDVNLGEFELLPKSIENWFPYNGVNELRYKNAKGDFVVLEVKSREKDMMRNINRTLCYENDFDSKEEIYYGEYINVTYNGTFDDVNYSLYVALQVYEIYYNDDITDLRLKDGVSYSFDIANLSGYLEGGVYVYTVDYRGNAIPNENIDSSEHHLLKMVDINGTTYNDVWYFHREYAPSIYIQLTKGVIAFQGLVEELWELQ